MEELLNAEAVLIRNLDGYLVEQGRKMEYLKRKLDEYQRQHKTASANISWYLSNPVNAFLITKRLTSEWKRIKYIMIFDVATEFLENITNSSKFLKFPTDEDLTGAVAALIRIQDTYKLNVSSFARGILNKVKYNTQMTANDCFEVGLHTYNNGDYYHTVLWMEEALERWDERSQTYYRDINKVDILDFLAYSLYSLGDIVAALNKTNELLQLMPDHQGALENREIFETEIGNLQRDWESDIPLVNKPVVYEDSPKEVYEMLCRGELEKTPAQQRPLRCRYISYSNLYLKIGPFKLEEANLDPYIVMFHEVLFDDEIQHIKISAKPRLSRAKVIGNQEGGDESSYRISKVAWLGETEHRILGRVVRRAADLTNLDMETSEELQVLNYGIGGQYEPHCDYFDVRTMHELPSKFVISIRCILP
ncbi:unnamed protein product [Hermetia illucens]|uniref:Prolyl 4-hydroxylase alpha subunit domain-containing protein n=1 Tax=Hermetia illucens TaxID=343691 RepID=A0A7R8YYG2_HERIL|nr:unnamed protein product [Hermetia illucens]